MSKGKHLKKQKASTGKKIGRGLLIVLLVLLILIGAVFAFVWSKLSLITYDDGSSKIPTSTVDTDTVPSDAYTDIIDPTDVPDATIGAEVTLPEAEPEETVDVSGLTMETAPVMSSGELVEDKEVMNILLLGTDELGQGFNTNSRSDVIILVSINKRAQTVKLVSFSRGIAAPFLDGQYKGKYEWITNLHRWGGANMVMMAIEECFKVECDYFVRVNFNTVKTVVDAIGGVDIELTKKEADYMNWYNRNEVDVRTTTTQKDCVEGWNNLDGGMALHFARLRRIDDDFARMDRQRKVILAAVNKLKGSDLMTLNNLADLALPLVQTNMSTLEIAKLILYAPTFLNSEFDQLEIPIDKSHGAMKVMSGASGWALNFEKTNAALHEFLYGTDNVG